MSCSELAQPRLVHFTISLVISLHTFEQIQPRRLKKNKLKNKCLAIANRMAKAKAKRRKGRKGKQAKLSKGKKRGGAKKKVAAKRKGARKKKVARRKAAPRPRITRVAPAPAPAFTEIPEEITSSIPETPEEPVMGSTEPMGTGDTGFTTNDESGTSM